jgi:hypothetical protein
VCLPTALVTSAFVAGSASAGPGDVIQNPGPVTMTVNGGGFINLAGKAFALPSTATPADCNNGTNGDVAVDDATKQQDLNIDFDGGASHGVTPPTAVDAQCNAGGGFTAAQDDSEVKPGNQPRQYITLTGSVNKDGVLTVPQASLIFPKFYVYASAANGVIDVVPTATSAATGTVNPLTGKANLHVNWSLEVIQAFFGIDCTATISMDLSSDPTDPANSGSIPVAPSAYNPSTGAVTVSGNTFPISGMTPTGGLTTRSTGVVTAGSLTMTDPAGTFTAANVGNAITINGAGNAGGVFSTTIASVTNATTIVLKAPAIAPTSPVVSINPATYTYGKSTQAVCDTVGTSFGVPGAPGASAAQLSVTSNVAFTPGAAVANNDAGTAGFETPLTVAAPGVLANDTGAGIAVTAHTSPAHGSVSIAGDGSYTYTPAAGYSGADSFTYTITDSFSRTATATVNLTVNPPGAPTATDDSYAVDYQTPLVTAPPGVLANDSGSGITVTGNTNPSHGTVTQNANGSFTYSPAAGYAGPDSYGYTITDGASQTANATVNLTVAPPAAPTAADDAYSVGFESALSTPAPGVLANDSGTGISVSSNTDPAHGTVTQNGDGGFTYTPNAGFTGGDSYTYTITDGFARTATATVNLTVNPPGGPVATNDAYTTAFDTALNTSAPGVLGNDTGNGITVTGNTDPSHGSVTQNADGSFTYTPTTGYSGADSYTYRITDGFAQTSTATVNLTVDAPTVQPGINGTVTDAGTGLPVAGIVVTLMQPNPSWVIAGSTTTAADGTYHFGALANGQYALRFWDGTGVHEMVWYNAKQTYKTADLVTVSSPTDAVDANQSLPSASTGVITGRTQTSLWAGIPGIKVSLYTQSNGFYDAATTGAQGYYQFNHVPAGNYYIQFTDPSGHYRSQWYSFKLLFFNANVVTVGSGTVRADAMLG